LYLLLDVMCTNTLMISCIGSGQGSYLNWPISDRLLSEWLIYLNVLQMIGQEMINESWLDIILTFFFSEFIGKSTEHTKSNNCSMFTTRILMILIMMVSCVILSNWGARCGRDCMVVGFTITYAISAYHH
jgi:quinol-cytochrome oxidoreductase complex cytochrome b subunit